MKTRAVVFACVYLFFASMGVKAQVTIHTTQLPENYYSNCWYEVNPESQGLALVPTMVQNFKSLFGKYFYSKDSIQIYGVAASLSTFDLTVREYDSYDANGNPVHVVDSSSYRYYLSRMCDTSAYDEAYEYFGLYSHEADSLRLVSPQLIVNIKTTPVTYYMDLGTRMYYAISDEPTPPLPFYEMYFDSSVTVADSFYVGMTCYNYTREDKCSGKWFYTWPILWNTLGLSPRPLPCTDNTAWYQTVLYPDGTGGWVFGASDKVYCIFPILDTNHRNDYIDTTGGGTSVAAAGLERFVAVLPNPAVTEVRVVSSVGMVQLDVYDMKGEKVMCRQATGSDVTFNVSAWQDGVYVLHLHTPLGVAVKRLVVKRE